MNRRGFLKFASVGTIFSLTGMRTLISGSRPGDMVTSGKTPYDVLCVMVENTTGEPLLPGRVVRYNPNSFRAFGYAQTGLIGKAIGVTTQEIAPNEIGPLVIRGPVTIETQPS